MSNQEGYFALHSRSLWRYATPPAHSDFPGLGSFDWAVRKERVPLVEFLYANVPWVSDMDWWPMHENMARGYLHGSYGISGVAKRTDGGDDVTAKAPGRDAGD